MNQVLRVGSQQAIFLPWIGFWNKLINVDTFVWSGGVDFSMRDYEHRVKLHNSWLTLSLDKATIHGPIKDVRLLGTKYVVERIVKELFVKRYKYHDRLLDIVLLLEKHANGWLFELDTELIKNLMFVLGITTDFRIDVSVPTEETKTLRLAARLERNVGTNYEYYAGQGARNYMDFMFPVPVWYQYVSPEASTDSILQLIALKEDALAVIRSSASFQKEIQ